MATNKNKSNGNKETPNKKPDSGNLKFLINAQYLKDAEIQRRGPHPVLQWR